MDTVLLINLKQSIKKKDNERNFHETERICMKLICILYFVKSLFPFSPTTAHMLLELCHSVWMNIFMSWIRVSRVGNCAACKVLTQFHQKGQKNIHYCFNVLNFLVNWWKRITTNKVWWYSLTKSEENEKSTS